MNDQDALTQFDTAAKRIPPHIPDGIVLVNAQDISPESINWLWRGWLALGKLHLLAGSPGQGKTTIAMSMASIVSAGGTWPDGTTCEAGNVLIWSSEDDASDTLVPRLIAAGDRSSCYFVKGTRKNGEIRPFDPADDLPDIEGQIERIGGVRLLILDPLVTVVKGDAHTNTVVRRALQPIVDLAARHGAAVLGITHFSKGTAGNDPTERINGSIAFAGVARGVFVAQRVRQADGAMRGVFAKSKSNLGSSNGGFAYDLEQVQIDGGIETSRIVWGESLHGDSKDLLADATEDGLYSRNELERLILSELKDGPVPTLRVLSSLESAGYSKGQINRCAHKLHIKKEKEGMSGPWSWRLPIEGVEPRDI
jgi:putative DNA primase/helicase